MDLERVHPELQQMVRRAPRLDVGSAWMRQLGRLGPRFLLPREKAPGVAIRTVRERGARLRLYVPERRSGAGLVWIHGGGMVIGAPQQDDRFCTETASDLGLTIASVDYRLAPEHPHPIPLQDSSAVWDWLQVNAESLGIRSERIAIGGASAGAGIAAALAHRLHDRGGMQPAAQWLLYPMLDDRTAADTSLDTLDHFVWNNVSNRMGWNALLRGVAATGTREVPAEAAPARREDLAGLPPVWIGVGDIDLFHAEDAQYASRLALAGVPVQFDTLPGAPHGFGNLALESSLVQAFMGRARAWLEDRLAPQES